MFEHCDIYDVLCFDPNLIHRYMVENMYKKVNNTHAEQTHPNIQCNDEHVNMQTSSEGQNINDTFQINEHNNNELHFDPSTIHSEKANVKPTSTSTSTLKCMYTNTDSLTNKLEELELFLHTHNVDMAAITETKPKTS